MVNHLSSGVAQVAGLFVEAVLYGVYLVTLGSVLVHILRSESGSWRRPSGIRAGTLTVALILAINSTLNLAWGLTRTLQTHVFKPKTNGPTWIDTAKPCTIVIQTLIADLFLSYRCWVVYGKSWKVAILPVFLSSGSFGVFIRTTMIQTSIKSYPLVARVKAVETLLPLFIAQFSLSTTLNIYATSAIVFRIWSVDRRISGLTPSVNSTTKDSRRRTRFQRIIKIIVESALIYTLASTLVFATYKSNVVYIISAINIMAVGIAFNLIVIRLARERARERRIGWNNNVTTLKFGTPQAEDPAGSMVSTQAQFPHSPPGTTSTHLNASKEKESV